ncbi:hypothetical protein D9757_000186 [Collybiopsis confluens]|uniref:DUF6593 domain-containing protein n=1 Tax=Collybiopsis confluens TaxID=2823264 RepID=A0A8H5I4X9_9AGAR|nr:hypothetical protein D9757_000186 [Collybiopsis confluens]
MGADMRTFKIFQLLSESATDETELYRFHHPATGLTRGLTTFHRQNVATGIFETAGQIDWLSDYNATVYFGLEEASHTCISAANWQICRTDSRPRIEETQEDESRRFKVDGSEYKWKLATSNSGGLFCVDSRGKVIATWNQEQSNLDVSPGAESILDRLVVTCFLNLWALRHLGQW